MPSHGFLCLPGTSSVQARIQHFLRIQNRLTVELSTLYREGADLIEKTGSYRILNNSALLMKHNGRWTTDCMIIASLLEM
jgi:hypothetical protein